MKNNSLCCVYRILNLINGKSYIGSTFDFKKRHYAHFNLLKKNKHYNKKLQRAYNKYGKDNLLMYPINLCKKEEVRQWEDIAFDDHNPEYNIAKSATMPKLNTTHSDETKRKMSETAKRINAIERTVGSNDKPIIDQYGNVYKSLSEASRLLGIHRSTICDNLKGRSIKTRKGYIFKYIDKENDL